MMQQISIDSGFPLPATGTPAVTNTPNGDLFAAVLGQSMANMDTGSTGVEPPAAAGTASAQVGSFTAAVAGDSLLAVPATPLGVSNRLPEPATVTLPIAPTISLDQPARLVVESPTSSVPQPSVQSGFDFLASMMSPDAAVEGSVLVSEQAPQPTLGPMPEPVSEELIDGLTTLDIDAPTINMPATDTANIASMTSLTNDLAKGEPLEDVITGLGLAPPSKTMSDMALPSAAVEPGQLIAIDSAKLATQTASAEPNPLNVSPNQPPQDDVMASWVTALHDDMSDTDTTPAPLPTSPVREATSPVEPRESADMSNQAALASSVMADRRLIGQTYRPQTIVSDHAAQSIAATVEAVSGSPAMASTAAVPSAAGAMVAQPLQTAAASVGLFASMLDDNLAGESNFGDHPADMPDFVSGKSTDLSAAVARTYGPTGTAQQPPTAVAINMQIAQAIDGTSNKFEIQLSPEELGSVEITMEFDGDQRAQLTILVERSETLDLLMKDQRQLERMLNGQGLQLDGGIQMGLQDGQQGRPQDQNLGDQSPNQKGQFMSATNENEVVDELRPLMRGNGLYDVLI